MMLEAFLTALILAILKCILFKGRVRDCTEVTEGKIHRQENTKTRPTIVYDYKGKLYRSTINHVFSEGILTENAAVTVWVNPNAPQQFVLDKEEKKVRVAHKTESFSRKLLPFILLIICYLLMAIISLLFKNDSYADVLGLPSVPGAVSETNQIGEMMDSVCINTSQIESESDTISPEEKEVHINGEVFDINDYFTQEEFAEMYENAYREYMQRKMMPINPNAD